MDIYHEKMDVCDLPRMLGLQWEVCQTRLCGMNNLAKVEKNL